MFFAGPVLLYIVLIPIAALILLISITNTMQEKCPHKLPLILRTWDFLPKPLRSLEPLDRVFSKLNCFKGTQSVSENNRHMEVVVMHDNMAFQREAQVKDFH